MNPQTGDRPTILVTGGTGQIGGELVGQLATFGTIVAPSHRDLDLISPASLRDTVRAVRPHIVVNAAGYTAVDRAETERDLCRALNSDAPALLAEECRRLGAMFVHYSTDYVFDGTKRAPYSEADLPAPLSIYGETKLAGEEAVAAAGGAHLILRTSWVYAPRGRNFPLTILRLARQRETLSIVNDQVGSPTSAASIAAGTLGALRRFAGKRAGDLFAAGEAAAGVYHMTAAGSTTWYDFARVILAGDPRKTEQVCRAVLPITTAEFGAPASRPAYSVLDNTKLFERFGVRLPEWRAEVQRQFDNRSPTVQVRE